MSRHSHVGYTGVYWSQQFHDLITMVFSIQRFSPVLWTLRGVRFQPSIPATSPRGHDAETQYSLLI
jgi:hypothetical protein